MSPSLPPSLVAKLSPQCRWRGCPLAKADGADYCAAHHEKQKGYQRKSANARLSKLRLLGLCRACGAPGEGFARCALCRGHQASRKAIKGPVVVRESWKTARARFVCEQGGMCAICRAIFSAANRPCLDHDHETGALRGALCRACNIGIGNLRDSPSVLRAAADYIESKAGRK